jgi:hypothetical protein
MSVPTGWQAQATSPATFSTVAPGQTAQTTWAVTVATGAAPGSDDMSAQATFTDANGTASASDTATISVPYASLAAAYDNPGITDDTNWTAGNLDGAGRSYSAQALATAGLVRGGTLSHDGLTFTWPDAQPGTPDNAVAGGQTIPVSGSGSTLGLLGTGNNGTATGSGTLTYTDGSTQPFTVALADWWANAAASGGDIVATMPYINNQTGSKISRKVSVYYAAIPIAANKTVAYVTLPDVSNGVANGQLGMHIFSLAVG